MTWDNAFAKAHDEIAQGISGAWWQANASLSIARLHQCPAEITDSLEILGADLLELLRIAQDLAASFNAERSGKLHIIPALEDQMHAFEAATESNGVELKISGDPHWHSVESLTCLYGAFKAELNRLAGNSYLPKGTVEVHFEKAEPTVQFSPDGTQPML